MITILLAALVNAGLALAPWPTSWPPVPRASLGATWQVLAGIWAGPWAALGVALGQAGVATAQGQLATWEALALVLAAAVRALLAWRLLAPGRADPRLVTLADWRRWAWGVIPVVSLLGAALERAPLLVSSQPSLLLLLSSWLRAAGGAALTLWVLGTLLLRWLSPLWRADARRVRPQPVDLAQLLAVTPRRR